MIRRLSSMRLAKIASSLAGIRTETGAACSTSALAPILFGFPLYRRCVRGTACPPSGRNSTYRSVQISEASSEVGRAVWLQVSHMTL